MSQKEPHSFKSNLAIWWLLVQGRQFLWCGVTYGYPTSCAGDISFQYGSAHKWDSHGASAYLHSCLVLIFMNFTSIIMYVYFLKLFLLLILKVIITSFPSYLLPYLLALFQIYSLLKINCSYIADKYIYLNMNVSCSLYNIYIYMFLEEYIYIPQYINMSCSLHSRYIYIPQYINITCSVWIMLLVVCLQGWPLGTG